MKKLLSMLLIAMLAFSVTACGGGEAKDDTANNDAVQQEEVQKDEAQKEEAQKEEVELSPWLKTKTGQFYSQFKDGEMSMTYETSYEGSVMKVITASNGDGKTYSESFVDGKSAGVSIMDGEFMYAIDHSNKMVVKMAVNADSQEMANVLMEESDVNPEAVVNGTYSIDGKTYETEEWEIDGAKSIMCFDGDDLAYIVGVYEGEEMAMKIVEFSAEVDDALFELPEDYEVMEF